MVFENLGRLIKTSECMIELNLRPRLWCCCSALSFLLFFSRLNHVFFLIIVLFRDFWELFASQYTAYNQNFINDNILIIIIIITIIIIIQATIAFFQNSIATRIQTRWIIILTRIQFQIMPLAIRLTIKLTYRRV